MGRSIRTNVRRACAMAELTGATQLSSRTAPAQTGASLARSLELLALRTGSAKIGTASIPSAKPSVAPENAGVIISFDDAGLSLYPYSSVQSATPILTQLHTARHPFVADVPGRQESG